MLYPITAQRVMDQKILLKGANVINLPTLYLNCQNFTTFQHAGTAPLGGGGGGWR